MCLQPNVETDTACLEQILSGHVLQYLSLALIKTASSSDFNFYFCKVPFLQCTINATR